MLHRTILFGERGVGGLASRVERIEDNVDSILDKQQSILKDLKTIKDAEAARANQRIGEEKSAKRLRRFLYVAVTLILGGGGFGITRVAVLVRDVLDALGK